MNRKMLLRAAGALTAACALAATVPARAAFDDVEVSPRSRGMGSAFLGLKPDVYAVFHNPASLGWFAGGFEGGASYVRPFGYDFSSQSVLSGAVRLPGSHPGALGVGFRRFGVEYRGEDLTGETTLSIAYGAKVLSDLQSELALGMAVNLYSLDYGRSVTGIDPGSATAVGVNVAAQAVVAERTTVGFYAHNLNNPSIGGVDEEELHRRVGVGAAYSPYRGVTTLLDISTELGREPQFRGGTEFEITEFLWLRGGLRTEPNIFTAGFGIDHSGFRFDYGFSTGGGVLDPTHQFGVGIALERGK